MFLHNEDKMLMGYSTQMLSILDTKSPPSLIHAECQRYIHSKVVVNHQKLRLCSFAGLKIHLQVV